MENTSSPSKYIMLATMKKMNASSIDEYGCNRGVYALASESPCGPFSFVNNSGML